MSRRTGLISSFINKYKQYVSSLIFGFLYYVAPNGEVPAIHISPNQFLHKFPGIVTVEELRPWPGVLSLAQISPGRCRISITPKSVVGEKMYECLYLVELANCNGAVDINAKVQRSVVPTGYERTCASDDWSSLYNSLAY